MSEYLEEVGYWIKEPDREDGIGVRVVEEIESGVTIGVDIQRVNITENSVTSLCMFSTDEIVRLSEIIGLITRKLR